MLKGIYLLMYQVLLLLVFLEKMIKLVALKIRVIVLFITIKTIATMQGYKYLRVGWGKMGL